MHIHVRLFKGISIWTYDSWYVSSNEVTSRLINLRKIRFQLNVPLLNEHPVSFAMRERWRHARGFMPYPLLFQDKRRPRVRS